MTLQIGWIETSFCTIHLIQRSPVSPGLGPEVQRLPHQHETLMASAPKVDLALGGACAVQAMPDLTIKNG